MNREIHIGTSTLFGLTAKTFGGDFWEGARQGATTSALNHLSHSFSNDIITQIKNRQQNQNGGGNISLYFDGNRLHIWNDATGSSIDSYVAYSGNGEGMNNPNFQNVANTGTIPQGNYSFSMSDIQTISPRNRVLAVFARGEWPGGTDSWGNTRVDLTPSPYTNTYGRGGFTIHGGAVPGSRGCLDLVGNNNAFFNSLYNATGGQGQVILRVRYEQ